MTCKDCLHEKLCIGRLEAVCDNDGAESCGMFDNKSYFIELPCAVGDTVYVNDRDGKPRKMILDLPDVRCHCSEEDNLCMALCGSKSTGICSYRLMNDGSDIGKTVFLNREEAEKARKERDGLE